MRLRLLALSTLLLCLSACGTDEGGEAGATERTPRSDYEGVYSANPEQLERWKQKAPAARRPPEAFKLRDDGKASFIVLGGFGGVHTWSWFRDHHWSLAGTRVQLTKCDDNGIPIAIYWFDVLPTEDGDPVRLRELESQVVYVNRDPRRTQFAPAR